MTSIHRIGKLLILTGMGMVVFSLFMLLDLAEPLRIDASILTDEAMDVIDHLRGHFGQYLLKMYIANAVSILGGLVMMAAGFRLTREPKHPPKK